MKQASITYFRAYEQNLKIGNVPAKNCALYSFLLLSYYIIKQGRVCSVFRDGFPGGGGCRGGAIFMIKQENVREIHVIMAIGNTVS